MAAVRRERWQAPEVVERPTAQGLRDVYKSFTAVTGINAAGTVCLVTGLLCLSLGLVFGWVEFSVVGVLAIATVSVCLLFTVGRARLEVRVEVPSRGVVVGDVTGGSIQVRNAAKRLHWGSRLDLPIGDRPASFSLPRMRPGEILANRFRIPTERRGLVRIGPASSVQGDPFALTGRETRWSEVIEVYVHPRTIALPGRQTGFVHDIEGHASAHLSAADMNFHALRPYVPGDDRRHVHWRSSARAGELLVRQFEESRMSRVAVALDTGRASYLDEEEFELAVSCAGSIVLQTLYSESPLWLFTSREVLSAVTPGRALDGLSLVERGTRGGIDDLVHTSIKQAPDSSVAICVTGSSSTMLQLRQACARFDVDTRVVGIRISLDDELRARAAGNVTVMQVGRLGDLPRGMRKAME